MTKTRTHRILFLLTLCAFAGGWQVKTGLGQPDRMEDINRRMPPPLELDNERIKANGIARVDGRHIRLLTDVRDRRDIFEFPAVFDAAVPQWCKRFGIDPKRAEHWQLTGIVMQGPESYDRFRAAGLIPNDLPPFAAGYHRGHEMWLFSQPGEYYTRHLLLHEGTHGFMQWFLGGSGPPWYSEGMAELLAVHSWENNQLKLGLENATRDGTPYWGRPKIIRDDIEDGLVRSLYDVMSIPATAFRNVDNYGWAWAACRFFDQHPESRKKFRSMSKLAEQTGERFNTTFRRKISSDKVDLEREWNLYIHDLQYSYSISDAVILPAEKTDSGWKVRADRGWQRTGISVEADQKLQIAASGRFQIKETRQPWMCEANGVTLEYYGGRPLGVLEVGIITKKGDAAELIAGTQVGLENLYRAGAKGELAFRINDSPAERHDNRGVLTVTVKNNP